MLKCKNVKSFNKAHNGDDIEAIQSRKLAKNVISQLPFSFTWNTYNYCPSPTLPNSSWKVRSDNIIVTNTAIAEGG